MLHAISLLLGQEILILVISGSNNVIEIPVISMLEDERPAMTHYTVLQAT